MAVENLSDRIIIFLTWVLSSTGGSYVVTLVMRQRRSIKLALFTAIIGSVVYVIAYVRLENDFLSAVLGGIAWLLALKAIYHMGWLKALIVAVVILVITFIIGVLLFNNNQLHIFP